MGRADLPPKQGIQCQFGKGTATEGIPRELRLSMRGWSSSAPVRNPGMMTAALISGSGGSLELLLMLLLVFDDDDDDEAARGVAVSIDLAMSKRRNMIELENIAVKDATSPVAGRGCLWFCWVVGD